MEVVLFDLYLAESEINNNYAILASDSTRKMDLLNSVFKKHKISEADLDNSLAWYAGHLEKYAKINENLSKRFSEMADELRAKEGLDLPQSLVNPSKTLFVEGKNFFLTVSDLLQHAYTFEADTTLQTYGGNYELQFHVLGVNPKLHPVVTFCAQCTDTTFVTRIPLENNGLFKATLTVLPLKQVEKLYGSIYFPEIYPSMNVFIGNFEIGKNQLTTNRHE
jgi:hypothetical protein